MLAILNFLNAHYFPIFQPILMILVSKFMVYRALSDKTYLSLGLLSPLKHVDVDVDEPWHELSNNVVCTTSKGSDQPAHTRRLFRAFACRLNIL